MIKHFFSPAVIKLVEQGNFHGEILDVGCGLGDNIIYIVTHTNNVPKAIEVAGEKAQKVSVNIQFKVIDILSDLSTTYLKQRSYDIILDAAIFHVFFE
ncbi:unnamed protein product [Rotaria sordida]|uniref:Methyltransferase domain-containing protein n=1 Tax=Rotaria sordida TaxID=392033 RepID=A0A815FWY9_9BILA|nr:unnamed protein product [Rotaria sordida]CAF1331005.1 unnamed protein product [Rotaria sordida]CAF3760542.1 unnamed protein product [Rotaria sordida]CAF3843706.1 unnamed protein product [Rotaria sordida]